MEQLTLDFSKHSSLLSPDEIYQTADQRLLSKLAEDKRLERKPAGIHARELAEYFCMWSNTVDGGLIVVGMEDRGIFSGCDNLSPGQLNAIEKCPYNYCPEARFNSKRVGVTSGRPVAQIPVKTVPPMRINVQYCIQCPCLSW
jgi:ATP-dependent DNA helicase RecG